MVSQGLFVLPDRDVFLSGSIGDSFLSPAHMGDHRFFHRKQGEKGNPQTETGNDRGSSGGEGNNVDAPGGEEKDTDGPSGGCKNADAPGGEEKDADGPSGGCKNTDGPSGGCNNADGPGRGENKGNIQNEKKKGRTGK